MIGRRRLTLVAVALATVLVLVGCQTTTDPAEGGFFSGVSNLSSGAYEQRLEKKKGELAGAQAEQAALEQRSSALDSEQASVSAELASAEQRLAALRADIDELDKKIQEASRQLQLDEEQRKRIEEELADLERAERLLSTDPVIDVETKTGRIEELERRKKRLEETLAEALAAG